MEYVLAIPIPPLWTRNLQTRIPHQTAVSTSAQFGLRAHSLFGKSDIFRVVHTVIHASLSTATQIRALALSCPATKSASHPAIMESLRYKRKRERSITKSGCTRRWTRMKEVCLKLCGAFSEMTKRRSAVLWFRQSISSRSKAVSKVQECV